MLIQDIKLPKNNLEAFEFWQNSWQASLIPMLSTSKKIEVKQFTDPRQHQFESGYNKGICYCADCAGDFSGASEDEDWGGR
jgi:DNA topoisomerase VI subunit A